MRDWTSGMVIVSAPFRQRSIRGNRRRALCGQSAISLRATVAEKLPHFADVRDHVEIQVRDHDLIFIAAGLGNDLAPGIAEITLAIEFANAPWFFSAHAINGADKVSIGNRMSG